MSNRYKLVGYSYILLLIIMIMTGNLYSRILPYQVAEEDTFYEYATNNNLTNVFDPNEEKNYTLMTLSFVSLITSYTLNIALDFAYTRSLSLPLNLIPGLGPFIVAGQVGAVNQYFLGLPPNYQQVYLIVGGLIQTLSIVHISILLHDFISEKKYLKKYSDKYSYFDTTRKKLNHFSNLSFNLRNGVEVIYQF